MKRFHVIALLVAAVGALTSSPARATLVTWELNPGNANGNVGSSSHLYTVSGYSINALGYDKSTSGADTLHQLFYKFQNPIGGAIEKGLGLVGTLDNELQMNPNGSVPHYIQLDLTSILALGFTGGEIQVGSIQAGESFRLFGSNSQGVLGSQLAGTWGSTFDDKFVSVPDFGNFKFISVASNGADVLPVAFRANITPVPEMNALFPIIGLVAAVSSTQILRRRRLARNGSQAS